MAIPFANFDLIDLTHPLTEQIPTWNGSCGFCAEVKKDYDQVFRVQKLQMHAGVGTHMDAPSHRFHDGISIAEIPLERLIAPVCLIDVSRKTTSSYLISLQDLNEYERANGIIAPNSLVIGYTGWDRFWSKPDDYRNLDANGQMHFPGFSSEVAEALLARHIVGIAIDTLSPDRPESSFPVHKLLLGANKYIIENIANASCLPAKGSYAIALPIKATDCTEAPIRIIALIPR